VPTLVESGYPDVSLGAWAGVVAPSGTPRTVVARLNALINEVSPAPRSQLSSTLCVLPKTGTPTDFFAFLAADLSNGREVIGREG
jgi:tripartite-type tricarboxylate transporter receptor subunit TctC